MLRGSRIHKEVEEYINGNTEDFPSSGKKLKETIEYCKERYAAGDATVEDQWAFTEDWAMADWFGDTTWLRMATDCTIFTQDAAEVYDWKTGKSFGNEVKYMQQMQLYAVGVFMRFPEINFVDVTLGFLDDGKTRVKHFERNDKMVTLMAKFTERGNRMTNCVDFRPKPNPMNCRYCPFGPGGTDACLFGVSPL